MTGAADTATPEELADEVHPWKVEAPRRSGPPVSRHPVFRFIREAASRNGQPTDDDIAALGLPAEVGAKISRACKEVAETFATGDQDESVVQADKASEEIIDSLPQELQDPTYLNRPAKDLPDDPKGLAEMVPRR